MSWGITLVVMVVTSVAVAVYIAWPLLVGRPDEDIESEEGDAVSALDELLVQKDATYSAIKELEFDHAMGNLSKEDYRQLASRYEDKAVALLKTIDGISQSGTAEEIEAPAVAGVILGAARGAAGGEAIEQQVASLRKSRGKARGKGRAAGLEDEIERDVARVRVSRLAAPVGNGNPAAEIERHVAALRAARIEGVAPTPMPAAPASQTGASCPSCGAPLKSASAAFCSRCGSAVTVRCPVCGTPAEEGDAFCSGCGTSLSKPDTTRVGQTRVGGANV